MKYRIGFTAEEPINTLVSNTSFTKPRSDMPVKSVVQVRFQRRDLVLSYYNDKFDLRCGDVVYVGGKMAGLRARVVDVTYNFKIKLSQYQKVVALVDTEVHGDFYLTFSHFLTLDKTALPREKVRAWYKAPDEEDEGYESGEGEEDDFLLDDLSEMDISKAATACGREYYIDGRVRYLSLDGSKGYAIVEGSENYEIEFIYKDGIISHLVCGCYCVGHCKHEYAAMLQLRAALDWIEENCAVEYERTGYLAVICKDDLFGFVLDAKETGKIIL